MKLKQLASSILVIALVAVVLGSVIVFAPPSDLVFPSLVEAFVTNNGPDEAVPVNVTNPLESLEVTVPDGVEITNTQPIDVQVTDVLEPQEGTLRATDVDFWHPVTILALSTEGYREMTIMFYASRNESRYLAGFHIGEEGDRSFFLEDSVTVGASHHEVVTYPIRGPWLEIQVYCTVENGLSDATIYYYMAP